MGSCRRQRLNLYYSYFFFLLKIIKLSGYFGPKKNIDSTPLIRFTSKGIKNALFGDVGVLMALTFTAEADCPRDENGDYLEEFSIDGCNMCTCDNDRPSCTEMACSGGCHMGYQPDTCSSCSCDAGKPICMTIPLPYALRGTIEEKPVDA